MSIDSVLNSGVTGFAAAQQDVYQASVAINQATTNTTPSEQVSTQPLTQSVVDLKVAEVHASANARTIQTAHDMLGTLIDIRV